VWGGEADVNALSAQSQTAELEKLAARDPQDRVVKFRLFRAYMMERRFPDAERLIETMMEQVQARQKRAERISFLKKVLKRVFTENSERAEDADSKDTPDQDAADLDQERQNLENAGALVERAHLYLATARAREAEQDLLQALRLNPRDGLAHYLMSIVHQIHNSEHARREELAAAVECDPAFLTARLELARARTESGDGFAALALLNQAPKEERSNFAYIAERNRALLAVDDRSALRKSLDRTLAASKTPAFFSRKHFSTCGCTIWPKRLNTSIWFWR
jgi:thioredoxin-like negative regulator of GroEL